MPNQCTQAEWKILEILWEQGGADAEQLIQTLQAQTDWTQHTVRTLLKRMQQKELIVMEENGSKERYVCRLPRAKVSIAPSAVCLTLSERLKAHFGKGGTHQ